MTQRRVRHLALLVWLPLLMLSWVADLRADDSLVRIKETGKLVWGADPEGGGPFVFPREGDPGQLDGFEVDLAALLGRYLGVEADVVQADWSSLPEALRARKVDIILNGFEWTPTRAARMEATMPYYVYGLQLLARQGDDAVSWATLGAPAPGGATRKVGVLVGSAAETYLRAEAHPTVEVVSYSGNTDSMREVETGKLDATVQDTPIVSFYGPRFPKLRPVGPAVGQGYYVAFARKGDFALVQALNEALVLALRSGELERIYQRYGMWGPEQRELSTIAESGRFFGLANALNAELGPDAEAPTAEQVDIGTRKRGWQVVRDYSGVMLQSAGVTVLISVVSFPLAILLGLLIAVGRVYGPGWLRHPLAAYVEFIRGTPLMLQLYFIFFFLPELGIALPALATAIVGLAINYSSYEAEIYRAGLQAIPPGQMEAALSLGMSRTMAIRRVIVPQAVRIVVPPVVNDFISLFKDTSVCSVVTVIELTKRYSVLSMSTQATVELMIMTAVLYLMMSYPMALVSAHLERRMGGPVPA